METQELDLTPRMLTHISNQISLGKPLWALFLVNEYLRPDTQDQSLRHALVKRAISKITSQAQYRSTQQLVKQALSGTRLADLTQTSKSKLKNFREVGEETKKYFNFVPPKTFQRSARANTHIPRQMSGISSSLRKIKILS